MAVSTASARIMALRMRVKAKEEARKAANAAGGGTTRQQAAVLNVGCNGGDGAHGRVGGHLGDPATEVRMPATKVEVEQKVSESGEGGGDGRKGAPVGDTLGRPTGREASKDNEGKGAADSEVGSTGDPVGYTLSDFATGMRGEADEAKAVVN